MRQIERDTMAAVAAKRDWRSANMEVRYLPELNDYMHARVEMSKVYLHGNHIATYVHSTGDYTPNVVTLAQWPTRTTLSRLRAFGCDVCTRKGVTYWNGRAVA